MAVIGVCLKGYRAQGGTGPQGHWDTKHNLVTQG